MNFIEKVKGGCTGSPKRTLMMLGNQADSLEQGAPAALRCGLEQPHPHQEVELGSTACSCLLNNSLIRLSDRTQMQ